MKKRRDNTKVIVIILTIIVVIWTIINLFNIFEVFKLYRRLSETNNTDGSNIAIENVAQNVTSQEIEDNANEKEIEGLQTADERTRMQQYCGKFIRYIENKEYSKAYEYLYPDFKNNYFPTLEEFSAYVQEKFPKDLIIVDYTNIERQGQYYILFTTITTPLDTNYSMEQEFFLVENDFNDFMISFEVKE